MTNEQRVEMFRMRLEGASLQEIADAYGVTREYVRQLVPPVANQARRRSDYSSCIYPVIAKWLFENRVSYFAFSLLCGTAQMRMYNALTGRVSPTKDTIDRILDATGLTYEEAFRKQEGETQ